MQFIFISFYVFMTNSVKVEFYRFDSIETHNELTHTRNGVCPPPERIVGVFPLEVVDIDKCFLKHCFNIKMSRLLNFSLLETAAMLKDLGYSEHRSRPNNHFLRGGGGYVRVALTPYALISVCPESARPKIHSFALYLKH